MWNPFKKREENVSKRLQDRILEHEDRITALEMDIDIFRNKVLRKIQGKKAIEEEEKVEIPNPNSWFPT